MIHIFDIDYTVIKRASAEIFLREALKTKIIRFSQISRLPLDLIKYKLSLPDEDFIENTVKKIAGIKKTDLENTAEVCFNKHLKKYIYTDASFLIAEKLDRGEKVIFATSSLDVIIAPLQKFLGINESLSSCLEYNDGITTGRLTGKSLFGINKKEAVMLWMQKNNIHPANACFYSDSYTDIPLLEYCGNPVAVNPDRILKKEAVKRGWKILKFTIQ